MPKSKSATVEDLIPLAPAVFHILLSLLDGERHGYALKREIARRTDGKLTLGAGVLYGSISKMLARGLIERRRYYRITQLGRRVAQAEAARMRELVHLASSKLGPQPA
jgi:DNA-binding PadR family transcriptional regulator